jgi:hypothetical protein
MPTFRTSAVSPRAPGPFTSTAMTLTGSYFPSRGLPFSLLVHTVALGAMVAVSVFDTPSPPTVPQRPIVADTRSRERVIMYLPALRPDGPRARGGPNSRGPLPRSSSDASSRRGLVYPGPQQIISDSPKPDNRFQTVLQPDLRNAPILKPSLALPNLVHLADAGLAPNLRPTSSLAVPATQEASEGRPAEPSTEAAASPIEPLTPALKDAPVDALSLEVPAPLPLPRRGLPHMVIAPPPARSVPSPADDTSPQTAAAPITEEPELEKAELPAAKPTNSLASLELEPIPIGAAGPRNLLALSVMPAVSEESMEFPFGEARGRFAISPEPNLDTAETEPRFAVDNSAERATETVGPGSIHGLDGAIPATVTISFGTSTSAKDNGPSNNSERRDLSGVPSGTVTGLEGGAGRGGAGDVGNAPFAGITIVGGARSPGSAAGSVTLAPAPRPLQTSYGLFVVSTERGGGGLPFFGVFGDQQVYTVFLDMRDGEADETPSWTLEFALAEEPLAHGQSSAIAKDQQGLVLPFPIVKKKPALTSDAVSTHAGKMIVVYALISVDGKMEQLSVKDSPDTRFNQPVLDALREWVFRPAVLDGVPVTIKALFGIRLSPRQ